MLDLTRRRLLALAGLIPGFRSSARAGAIGPSILYNNDTTNLMSCVSPWHKRGQGFSEDLIDHSVREVAGLVDAHFLAPGLGWVPWWQSAIYPPAAHYSWFKEMTGREPDTIGKYLENGGDIVAAFIKSCRAYKTPAYISFRLNDAHLLEFVDSKDAHFTAICKFYYDNPHLRIGHNPRSASEHVHNWAIAEARNYKLAFIKEICNKYDLDGLELDFERFPSYFVAAQTTSSQRRQIMADVVGQVAGYLAEGGRKFGRPRKLCVRIPSVVASHDSLGINVPAFVEAGANMIIASSFFVSEQFADLAQIKKQAGAADVYLEVTHVANAGQSLLDGYERAQVLLTNERQVLTSARIARKTSLRGLSFFNFAYYRPHGPEQGEASEEPPFEWLRAVRDEEKVNATPPWYFVTSNKGLPHKFATLLPRKMEKDDRLGVSFPNEKPETWRRGELRIHVTGAQDAEWTVALKDRRPEPPNRAASPPHPGDEINRGQSSSFATFGIDMTQAKNGEFMIQRTGPAVEVDYIDLILS